MIAVDSSSLVAFLSHLRGDDVDAVAEALEAHLLLLPPVVVTEILSDQSAGPAVQGIIEQLPMLPTGEGFWIRAGLTRAAILARGLKARLPDALVCQTCLDHDLALITRDADFRHFAKHCGLKLALPLR